jgi:hypothetical protein
VGASPTRRFAPADAAALRAMKKAFQGVVMTPNPSLGQLRMRMHLQTVTVRKFSSCPLVDAACSGHTAPNKRWRPPCALRSSAKGSPVGKSLVVGPGT